MLNVSIAFFDTHHFSVLVVHFSGCCFNSRASIFRSFCSIFYCNLKEIYPSIVMEAVLEINSATQRFKIPLFLK